MAMNHNMLGTVTPAVSQQTNNASLAVGNATLLEPVAFDPASPLEGVRCDFKVYLRSRQYAGMGRGVVIRSMRRCRGNIAMNEQWET